MRKSAAPSQVRNVGNGLFSNSGHKRSIQSVLSLLDNDNKIVTEFYESKSSIPKRSNLQKDDSDCENNDTGAVIDSQSIPQSTNSTQFKVVWGKPSTKKHKTWEGDGFLELTMKSAILKDEDKTIISTKILHKPLNVEVGQILTIGSKVVEIIEPCSTAEPPQRSERFNEDAESTFRPSKLKKTTLSDTVSSSSDNLCRSVGEDLPTSSYQVFHDNEQFNDYEDNQEVEQED